MWERAKGLPDPSGTFLLSRFPAGGHSLQCPLSPSAPLVPSEGGREEAPWTPGSHVLPLGDPQLGLPYPFPREPEIWWLPFVQGMLRTGDPGALRTSTGTHGVKSLCTHRPGCLKWGGGRGGPEELKRQLVWMGMSPPYLLCKLLEHEPFPSTGQMRGTPFKVLGWVLRGATWSRPSPHLDAPAEGRSRCPSFGIPPRSDRPA